MRRFETRSILLFVFLTLFILGNSALVLALRSRQAISAGEFWQRVDQTITALDRAKSQSPSAVPAVLDGLAEQWASVDAVTFADGSRSELDTGYLVGQLRQRPYDLAELLNIFIAMQETHKLDPTRSFGAADLAGLQIILQRAEFQWNQPPSPVQAFLQNLWEKFNAWLNSLFGQNGISIPALDVNLLTIVASIVLAGVLLYVFRGLFGDLIVENRLDEAHLPGDELLTADAALQRAKEISQTGDYRTAVRYLYLSSLLLLDERGLLRFDRSKTNREYLRSVASFPHLSAPLHDVIDVFDRVWYGFQPLDQDGFKHYVEKVDELREQKK